MTFCVFERGIRKGPIPQKWIGVITVRDHASIWFKMWILEVVSLQVGKRDVKNNSQYRGSWWIELVLCSQSHRTFLQVVPTFCMVAVTSFILESLQCLLHEPDDPGQMTCCLDDLHNGHGAKIGQINSSKIFS